MHFVGDGLWVSDIRTVAESSIPDEIDVAVSVCQDSASENVSVEHRHQTFEDRPREWYGRFIHAADEARAAREHGPTVVYCHAGMHRSPSVTAACYGVRNGVEGAAALRKVCNARPQANPTAQQRAWVKRYVSGRLK